MRSRQFGEKAGIAGNLLHDIWFTKSFEGANSYRGHYTRLRIFKVSECYPGIFRDRNTFVSKGLRIEPPLSFLKTPFVRHRLKRLKFAEQRRIRGNLSESDTLPRSSRRE
jgi:hypothetical protein